jgi:hypothetical protein
MYRINLQIYNKTSKITSLHPKAAEESPLSRPGHAIGTSCNSGRGGGASALGDRYIAAHEPSLRPSGPARLPVAASCRSREAAACHISAYLNGLTTVEADFTQVNSDGTISTGKIYIKRPGRVRFEYGPPDRSLVIAGGSTWRSSIPSRTSRRNNTR